MTGLCWVWIAVDRFEHRFLGCVTGSRSDATARSFWQPLYGPSVARVMTDHWMVYPRVIPSRLHLATKRETFTVEGYNSLLRHSLARLRRRTKCYSKSREMLELSLRLLMAKWNGELSYYV